MRVFLGVLFFLFLGIVIFVGHMLWKIDKNGKDWLEEQAPHLTILSDEPIVVDSWIKVSAFSPSNEQRDYVPMIKIIKLSDNSYHGGKAVKFLMQTEWSLIAPSEAGDYILQYEGMEEPFAVHLKDSE